MSKVNKDDIGAVCARIDAQTRIFIEINAHFNVPSGEEKFFIDEYTKKYDKYAKNFRKNIIDKTIEEKMKNA